MKMIILFTFIIASFADYFIKEIDTEDFTNVLQIYETKMS